ncbi:MAG: TIGR03936 family radical SAM-associated protein [Lachnospiraceae bacterium]|nr:TIGR03936 family radical SAM-associated protein [Lachnospiraceae bacterium]
MKLRIKFSKIGVLKYIGHLDLMRYFQKAFRRTDIRVKYSTGFSPHMIMSFAQALGVGVESEGEYFDVEVEDGQDVSLMKDKLNAQMAEGITVLEVTVLPEKAGNAMASVAAATYEIEFVDGNPLNEEVISKFKTLDDIPFTKTTKTGEHTFNIKDFVYEIDYLNKGFSFCCDCSSAGNLKPKFLVDTLLNMMELNPEDYLFHILRKDLFLRNSKGELVPLNCVE